MGRKKIKDGILAIDPFDISKRPTPSQLLWAKWFADIVKDIPIRPYHIRRIHYRTLGKPKPDGKPYENTTNDSTLLGNASVYARYLGLVDFDAIEDHKNEGEVVNVVYKPDEVQTDFMLRAKPLFLQTHDIEDLIENDGSNSISYGVSIRQPYHLEIWVEKSTVNDILIPIAREYGATLMVASGHFSLTNVKDLYLRIKDLQKSVRIFYLRDFDPAGETMAKAVARKIEWFIRNRNPEIDLRLFDVALTQEQCIEYHLPRSPMDRKDRYKKNFEDRYGEGATELDALEAIHPGALRNIVVNAISPYFDEDLEEEINDLANSEQDRYDQFEDETISSTLRDLQGHLEPLLEKYNCLIKQANEVGSEINGMIGSTRYDFEPEYPEFSSKVVEQEQDCLLDTQIPYGEQLQKYHKG